MSSKDKIIKYNDFIPEKLSFTKMEENDKVPNSQMLAYPRYSLNGVDTSQFNIQFPWVEIISYGVPKANQYFKSDADRSKVKLPLNTENPELTDLIEMLKKIDNHIGSPETLSKIIGKKSKKYKYLASYKDPSLLVEEDDDDEDSEKKPKKTTNYIKYPYITLKLGLTYPDKQYKTELFETELSPDKQKTINRELVQYTTIDEFSEKVCYKSRVRPIVKPFKIWAHNASKKDPECGITWRIERIEVDKDSIMINSAGNLDSKKFIDSDSEDELPQIKVSDSVTKKSEPVNNKSEPINKKAESDSESDDEPPVVKKVDKKSKKVESDSESDDEPPVVKKVDKKSKKVESDSESDDEPAPVVKSKKVESDSDSDSDNGKQYTNKQKQIAQVDSDDSDEEEVAAKPPPPPPVATKGKKAAATKTKSK
jgi:hypothetical protein